MTGQPYYIYPTCTLSPGHYKGWKNNSESNFCFVLFFFFHSEINAKVFETSSKTGHNVGELAFVVYALLLKKGESNLTHIIWGVKFITNSRRGNWARHCLQGGKNPIMIGGGGVLQRALSICQN